MEETTNNQTPTAAPEPLANKVPLPAQTDAVNNLPEGETASVQGEAAAPADADELSELEAMKKDLERREQEFIARQLEADTVKMLLGYGMPEGLSKFLMGESMEDAKKNVEEMKVVFDRAVQEKVAMRLRGTTPRVSSGITGGYGFSDLTSQVQQSLI